MKLRYFRQWYFHSATISTIFKDYSSLLMFQSSLFNVVSTNKMTKFIGVMKSACRFDHSKEKMDLHASLHRQEDCQYQKYLLKLSEATSCQSAQFSKLRHSEGITVY